jgi:hypothetical protein
LNLANRCRAHDQNDGFLMDHDLLTWRIRSCSVEFI